MKKILTALIISCQIFSSNAHVIEDKSNLQILTPSLKERKTLKLKLKNGLSVYLISDKNIDKSSAGLSVKVGSWQDPKEFPGMAHYTEHMLFMGSHTYPGESAFMNYINDHGGSNNAYTACDRTVYGFSINNDAFLDGLKMFSHFFIDPIISKAGMKSELHAVDQEYSKNIEHDGWRKYRIEKELANTDHPHHGFSCGNSKTLVNIPQEQMKKWIDSHYSANNMNLLIYSPLDIEELEKATIEQFSKIPDRKLPSFDQKQKVFSNAQKGKIVFIEPVRDLQQLSLSWELPKSFNTDPSQSAELLAYTFSRGAKNSLLQLLKDLNLADDLDASVEKIGNQATFFQIDVSLTNQGIKQYPKVIELCFEAIKTYANTPFPSYLFDERKKMRIINYEYQSRTDAFGFAMKSADNMADEDLAVYPAKKVVPTSFNRKKTEQILKYLKPENGTVYLLTNPVKLDISLDKQEQWLGGKYTVKPLEMSFSHVKESVAIGMPPRNDFIPNNLKLQKNKKLETPLEISSSKKDLAYFYPDNYYYIPEVAYLLQIQSPSIEKEALSSTMVDVWIKCSTDILSPTLLTAKDAGLTASLSTDSCRIKLEVGGYSENAPLLLEKVLAGMKTIPTKEMFSVHKNALMKGYFNKDKDLPVVQASNLVKTILVEDVNSYQKKLKALQELSYDEFIEFHQNLLKKTYLEALYTGNINLSEAKKIHAKALSLLPSEPFTDFYQRKVIHFPSNQGPFMIQKPTDSQGNACFLVLDEGSFSFNKRAAHQILSQAFSSDFFDSLRTKQKTGYIAQSWDSVVENQLFQFFAVQSSSHEPLDLLYRFDLFLDTYAHELSEKISDKRFNQIKKSLADQLQTPPINLYENAYRLQKFAFEYKDFAWIEKRIQGLKEIAYEKFLEVTAPLISRQNKKRVAVLYSGKVDLEKEFSYKPVSTLELEQTAKYFPKNIAMNDEL